jgi:hypothetical protein
MIPRLHREPEISEMWRHKQQEDESTDQTLDEIAIATLIEAFSGDDYGWEIYVDTARVGSTYVSVLGRVVMPEDCISNPKCDRLLLPATA